MRIANYILITFQEYQEVVKDIVDRPEYSHLKTSEEGLFDSFYERILKWLGDLLLKVFGGDGYIQGDGRVISVLFIVFIVAAVIALIIFLVFKTKGSVSRRPKDILGEKINGDTTPISLRHRAEDALREGNYREAVRLQYIALLLSLHESKVIYLEDSMTNYEIYIKLKNNDFHSLDTMAEIMEVFNTVWYGQKKFTSMEYDSFSSRYQELWNEVIKSEEAS